MMFSRLPSVCTIVVLGLLSHACDSSDSPSPRKETLPRIRPAIVRTLPHDTTAFTQGLVLRDGFLFESTGKYGRSSLRKLDTATGEVVRRVSLDRRLFGEGLAFHDESLVQLTWREGRALVYAYPDLTLRGEYRYEGEGWGLTAIEESLVMSDGSDTLTFLDERFAPTRRLAVTLEGRPLTRLNELEYARGMIYANVWHSDFIFAIDPASGAVRRVIDCTALAARIPALDEQAVLNGIAYSDSTGTFFLTGKNWPLLFEVTLPE
jgi:glutamine cyclotransferase